ncbi:MAG TPA: hypothetical protein DSN98_07765 [Thermoplasmata archaeon]|nr:MAG TPA: hypothetical protein DSN98_07765 [Thermoplasmata archaeon]
MRNDMWTKGLVVGIIILFVGTSVVPTITGNIKDVNNESYKQGNKEIKTRQTIASSLITENILTTSDVSIHPDEAFTKKLRTEEYRQSSGDRSLLTYDDISLSQPLNNDIFRAGDIIEIQGTASGSTFQNYFIEWGIGENPSQWFSIGILLVNDGLVAIVNDTLAIWNTSLITDDDFFIIRLTVNFTTYQNEEYIRDLYLDPTLKEGWPQKINYEYNSQGGYYYWAGYLETVVDDINDDGRFEIIVYKGGNPPKLNVYCDNGALLWSAPVGNTEASGGNLHLPLVGDINNDGFDEIIVFLFLPTQSSNIYVFDHNGTVLDGWPIVILKEYHPTLILADVNNDGYDEIIFKGNDASVRKLLIINHNGTIIEQWTLSTKSWGSSIESSPAVGNFDNDPELEIVCADPSENAGYNSTSGEWNNEGVIHVYNIDGSEVPGWPKYTDGVIFTSPATGDIDNNGDVEIVVGLQFAGSAPDDRFGGLYAFDKNGNVLPGWPFEKGWNFASAPSLADFDDDGDLEITASRLGFYTYVIHHDGALASGWPQQTTWNDYYSTIIGDINNDNIPDILTTAGDGFYPSIYQHGGVYAWNYDGTPIPGFPKVTDVDAQGPATIADIDNDDKVEIIASSDWDHDFETGQDKYRGSIYVWDVDAPYNQSTMEWPTFHHDLQRTGMYPYVPSLFDLEVGNVTGGLFTVKATIKNIGGVTANNINWSIMVTDGLILSGRKTTGSISTLISNDEQTLTSKPIIGFGKTVIKIIATVPGNTASKEQNATILLFLIRMK